LASHGKRGRNVRSPKKEVPNETITRTARTGKRLSLSGSITRCGSAHRIEGRTAKAEAREEEQTGSKAAQEILIGLPAWV